MATGGGDPHAAKLIRDGLTRSLDVEEVSSATASLRKIKHERQRKQRSAVAAPTAGGGGPEYKQLADEMKRSGPPVLPYVAHSLGPKAPGVLSISKLVNDFPHLCNDPSKPDRCKGPPPSSSLSSLSLSSSSSSSSAIEPIINLEHVLSLNPQFQFFIDKMKTMHKPLLVSEIEGVRHSHEETLERLRQGYLSLPVMTASLESEQLGESGSHVHINGTRYDFPPCSAGARCVWLTRRNIRVAPRTDLLEPISMPRAPPPPPPSVSSSSSAFVHSLKVGTADDDEEEDEADYARIAALIANESEEDEEESKEEKKTKAPSPPPAIKMKIEPVDSSSSSSSSSNVAMNTNPGTRLMLPDQWRHFLDTNQPPDDTNKCILCVRLDISELVYAARGTSDGVPVPRSTILNYYCNMRGKEEGYIEDAMIERDRDRWEGLVGCLVALQDSKLFKYRNAHGRWMIDQSQIVYRAPGPLAVALPERLRGF